MANQISQSMVRKKVAGVLSKGTSTSQLKQLQAIENDHGANMSPNAKVYLESEITTLQQHCRDAELRDEVE